MTVTVPALRCAGLVHVYRVAGTDVAALRGVDLAVQPGQRVALLGRSGSGKSTLLSIVAGVMTPSAGTAEVFGEDLGQITRAGLRRLRGNVLGLMLQGAATNLILFDDAVGNIDYVTSRTLRGDRSVGLDVLDAAGFADLRTPVGLLSPSEQQVVAFAVAMSTRPKLLLMDEPTSRLGDAARDHLLDVLVDATAQQGTAVLVVTHDESVARRMDRMIHIRDGRIAEEATASGRFAVIGADGSVQLPEDALQGAWAPGSLVTVEVDGERAIHLRPQ
ncbi:ABC transporter ATP-binding protein [Amnibacterium kyonggiense]